MGADTGFAFAPEHHLGHGLTLPGKIFRTVDGGDSWKQITEFMPPPEGFIHDIHFLDARTAYGIGHNGLIVKTMDGCSTWSDIALKPSGTGEAYLTTLYFSGPYAGYIVGNNGLIYKLEREPSAGHTRMRARGHCAFRSQGF